MSSRLFIRLILPLSVVILAVVIVCWRWEKPVSPRQSIIPSGTPSPTPDAQTPKVSPTVEQSERSKQGDAEAPRVGPAATPTATTAPSTPETAGTTTTPPVAPSTAAVPAAQPDPIGQVQPVAPDTNAQVASVAEALRTKSHPERLSTLIQPAPFDRVAYQRDPAAYANVVEPGRAFQSAQPGPSVPVLHPVGTTQMTMPQDGQVVLRARTEPGMPITFTSLDLGRFGNQLVSQTAIADAQGIAAVAFFAGPGTIDGVRILAGSPVASGQIQFQVQVTPAPVPASPATATGG
jgi:cytoskeletal protein RodZ